MFWNIDFCPLSVCLFPYRTPKWSTSNKVLFPRIKAIYIFGKMITFHTIAFHYLWSRKNIHILQNIFILTTRLISVWYDCVTTICYLSFIPENFCPPSTSAWSFLGNSLSFTWKSFFMILLILFHFRAHMLRMSLLCNVDTYIKLKQRKNTVQLIWFFSVIRKPYNIH